MKAIAFAALALVCIQCVLAIGLMSYFAYETYKWEKAFKRMREFQSGGCGLSVTYEIRANNPQRHNDV